VTVPLELEGTITVLFTYSDGIVTRKANNLNY